MKSYKCITINGKQVRLHRALMEAYLGRKLMPWELVHHRDGNKHNNELSNLAITIRGIHIKIHRIGESTRFETRYAIVKEDLPLLGKFYNTNAESGAELAASKKQAGKQEAEILNLFAGGKEYTPSEIAFFLSNKNYPITSIRRAMTNLTQAGFLEKTDRFKMGPLGKREHIWKGK